MSGDGGIKVRCCCPRRSRAGPRKVVQNTYIYTNLRVSGETRVRPNDPLTLHFKSRLVFPRGSSTIRMHSRCPD